MKKLIKILLLLCASSLFAQLNKTHRIIEVGADANVGVSNSAIGITDFLVKDLVIDVQDFVNRMDNTGLTVNFSTEEKTFVNFNLGIFRTGIFSRVEGFGNISFSKELFDMLANGNDLDKSYHFSFPGSVEFFADAGAKFSLALMERRLRINFIPSYYVPILYVPDPDLTLDLKMGSNGKIKAHMDSNVDIYSIINLQPIIEDERDTDKIRDEIFDAIKTNGGISLTMGAEYGLFNSLDIAFSTQIPITAGKVSYKARKHIQADFEAENILDTLLNDGDIFSTKDYGISEWYYSEEELSLRRPFRLDFSAVWHPMGYWMTVTPNLGFVLRNPGGEYSTWYLDAGASFDLTMLYFLGFHAGIHYKDKIFINSLGVSFNFRIVEIIAQAQLQSASFINSFVGAGVGAYIGARIGI